MWKYRFGCLSIIFFFLLLTNTAGAADFNIKLRKTDINDLKQQLMPAFEQNIQLLKNFLSCLEQGRKIDICIETFTVTLDGKSKVIKNERTEQIKLMIQKKISAHHFQQDQMVLELNKLLLSAKKVKQCLQRGETANALKDCILQYSKSIH